MIDISTVLLWVAGTILWGIVAKMSNNRWVYFVFGCNAGMLLAISILYILTLGGK